MAVSLDPFQNIIEVHWKKKNPDNRGGNYYAILSSWPEGGAHFGGATHLPWMMATRLKAPGGTRWTTQETFYVGPYQIGLGIIDIIYPNEFPQVPYNRLLSGWRVDPQLPTPVIEGISQPNRIYEGDPLILPEQGQMKDYYLWAAAPPKFIDVAADLVDSCIINLGKVMADFEGGFGPTNSKSGVLTLQMVGWAAGQHMLWDLRIFEPDKPVSDAPGAAFNEGAFSVMDAKGRLTYSTPQIFHQEGRIVDDRIIIGTEINLIF